MPSNQDKILKPSQAEEQPLNRSNEISIQEIIHICDELASLSRSDFINKIEHLHRQIRKLSSVHILILMMRGVNSLRDNLTNYSESVKRFIKDLCVRFIYFINSESEVKKWLQFFKDEGRDVFDAFSSMLASYSILYKKYRINNRYNLVHIFNVLSNVPCSYTQIHQVIKQIQCFERKIYSQPLQASSLNKMLNNANQNELDFNIMFAVNGFFISLEHLFKNKYMTGRISTSVLMNLFLKIVALIPKINDSVDNILKSIDVILRTLIFLKMNDYLDEPLDMRFINLRISIYAEFFDKASPRTFSYFFSLLSELGNSPQEWQIFSRKDKDSICMNDALRAALKVPNISMLDLSCATTALFKLMDSKLIHELDGELLSELMARVKIESNVVTTTFITNMMALRKFVKFNVPDKTLNQLMDLLIDANKGTAKNQLLLNIFFGYVELLEENSTLNFRYVKRIFEIFLELEKDRFRERNQTLKSLTILYKKNPRETHTLITPDFGNEIIKACSYTFKDRTNSISLLLMSLRGLFNTKEAFSLFARSVENIPSSHVKTLQELKDKLPELLVVENGLRPVDHSWSELIYKKLKRYDINFDDTNVGLGDDVLISDEPAAPSRKRQRADVQVDLANDSNQPSSPRQRRRLIQSDSEIELPSDLSQPPQVDPTTHSMPRSRFAAMLLTLNAPNLRDASSALSPQITNHSKEIADQVPQVEDIGQRREGNAASTNTAATVSRATENSVRYQPNAASSSLTSSDRSAEPHNDAQQPHRPRIIVRIPRDLNRDIQGRNQAQARPRTQQWINAVRDNNIFRAIANNNINALCDLLNIENLSMSNDRNTNERLNELEHSGSKIKTHSLVWDMVHQFFKIDEKTLSELIKESRHEFFFALLYSCYKHERSTLAKNNFLDVIILNLAVENNQLSDFIAKLRNRLRFDIDSRVATVIVDVLTKRKKGKTIAEKQKIFELQMAMLNDALTHHQNHQGNHRHVIKDLNVVKNTLIRTHASDISLGDNQIASANIVANRTAQRRVTPVPIPKVAANDGLDITRFIAEFTAVRETTRLISQRVVTTNNIPSAARAPSSSSNTSQASVSSSSSSSASVTNLPSTLFHQPTNEIMPPQHRPLIIREAANEAEERAAAADPKGKGPSRWQG